MLFKVSEEQKEQVILHLEKALNEYLLLSQMFSFEGTQEDFHDLDRFASSYLEYFMAMVRGEDVGEWGWGKFKELRSPTPSKQGLKELIEHITYHVGDHDCALHTGERWRLISSNNGMLMFSPLYSPSIRLSHLQEVKDKFVFVEDLLYSSEGLKVYYRGEA